MTVGHTVLNGQFRLERKIGAGGFAQVFLATDLHLDRQVAIKVLHPGLLAGVRAQGVLDRFLREARFVAALEHPNILDIYQLGQSDGAILLVMPYVDGGSLADRLAAGPPLAVDLVALYLDQVAAALDYAQGRGVIHRDLKPHKMLLSAAGERLLLADFGIAKVMSDVTAQNQTVVVGTLAYMAPEQFQGTVTATTDIYALGCVLFQLLAGHPPFGGASGEIMYQKFGGPIPRLGCDPHRPLPSTLQSVTDRALARDPQARFPRAGDLARTFRAALVGDTPPYEVTTVRLCGGHARPDTSRGVPVGDPPTVLQGGGTRSPASGCRARRAVTRRQWRSFGGQPSPG